MRCMAAWRVFLNIPHSLDMNSRGNKELPTPYDASHKTLEFGLASSTGSNTQTVSTGKQENKLTL